MVLKQNTESLGSVSFELVNVFKSIINQLLSVLSIGENGRNKFPNSVWSADILSSMVMHCAVFVVAFCACPGSKQILLCVLSFRLIRGQGSQNGFLVSVTDNPLVGDQMLAASCQQRPSGTLEMDGCTACGRCSHLK